MIVKICKNCGKEFKVKPSRQKSKYCSRFCYWKDKRQYPLIKKVCSNCGKKFHTPSTFGNKNFCSYKCYWKTLEGKGFFAGKKHTQLTKEKIRQKNKGKRCSILTEIKPLQHLSPQTEFKKGHNTWNKGLKGYMAGENNPNWKPPEQRTTPIQKQVRKSYQFQEWRDKVFGKDNYICQDCRQKGNKLNPHHKKEFAKIWKENNIKTFEQALACKELWDIDNGITLCYSCHRKKHKNKF